MHLRDLFEFVTDTPAFQHWFAGSKIVDSAGKPLRLYHGTSKDQDFRKFRVPGNGVWFATSPKDASDYAEQNDSQNFKWDYGGYVSTNTASRVMPVYVRAVNPLYVTEFPSVVQMAGSRGGDPTRAYRAAQRQWFDRLRAEGHDAVVIGDHTVVVLKDASQIKSAIGNKSFNPAKPGMTEAAIPLGQPASAAGFTFGFEAEFVISEGFIYAESMRDIDEIAADHDVNYFRDYFDMPDLDDALAIWQEDHPEDDADEMLATLGAREFLKRVDARVSNSEARYDPSTGEFAVHDKSQLDAFYDVSSRLSEDLGLHAVVFREDHQRIKQPEDWYLEPDSTVRGDTPGDYDGELTSPVFDDYMQFLDDLQAVLDWIGQETTDWVYTNGTCGLHINIGPPKSFDPIKFIVFAGEEWLARLFPRVDSQQTRPVIDALRDTTKFARSFDAFVRRLRKQLRTISDKMFLVNFLPWVEGHKYVEVRAMGGRGYEKRVPEIKRHIDRLLTLFAIASDPNKYRQTYMRKVYRYFIAAQPDALSSPQQSMAAKAFLQYARKLRVPDRQIARWIENGRIIATPLMVMEWLVNGSLGGKAPNSALIKLICHEIGLRRSMVADLPEQFPGYTRERYASEIEAAVQQLQNYAIPG